MERKLHGPAGFHGVCWGKRGSTLKFGGCCSSFFSSLYSFSFVSKNYHRINSRRPFRWDVTGEQCYGEEQESDAEEGGRVCRFHLIEQSLEHSGQSERGSQTEQNADRCEHHPLFEDELEDIECGCAQGNPQPDFTSALCDDIRDDSINPQNRQRERNHGEDGEQQHIKAWPRHRRPEHLLHSLHIGDRLFRIKRPDLTCDSWIQTHRGY